ncbi:angiopoietin-related protein 6 [Procambarus clarkii]|uniref:angiopoietin-related protein 6 n=1 Tax=Procambarus clarkii TaxID=6728 RepID=UPI0037426A31
MSSEGGGWTVVLARTNNNNTGGHDTTPSWEHYRYGLGTPLRQYWLGMEALHQLTSVAEQLLQVDVRGPDGTSCWSQWSTFAVGDKASGFKVQEGQYTSSRTFGDAPSLTDVLSYSNSSTAESEAASVDSSSTTDGNCVATFGDRWWLGLGGEASPGGVFVEEEEILRRDWTLQDDGTQDSAYWLQMKIRTKH